MNTGSITIGQPIKNNVVDREFNPLPNIDLNYGPYNSAAEVIAALPKKIRSKGLTVGIISNEGIEEYWFKEGIEDSDLVLKGATYDDTEIKNRLNRIEKEIFVLSVSISNNGSLKELGTTANVTVSWIIKLGKETIIPDSITINDEIQDNQSTSKVYNNVNKTTTYNIIVKKGEMTATAKTTVTFIAPIYIGFSNVTEPDSSMITSLNKQPVKTNPTGTYNVSNNSNENYLWICVPSSMNVNTVKSSGFDVPIEPFKTASTSIDSYKCYRSSSKINTGDKTFVVS